MMQTREVFDVGDRVIYIGFGMAVAGIITEVKVETPENDKQSDDRRRYRIAIDGGGILTRISRHLRRAL